ncbi:RecX family transcriptional regulator [soil metagenome]
MEPSSENETVGAITSVETQHRKADRVSVFIDGEFAFGARAETLANFGLSTGDQVSQRQKAAILQADDRAAAYEAAVSVLTRRPRSEREVRDRLRRKGYDEFTIDHVIERLRERHYLDDDAFARIWVENRTSFRPRGEMALRQELRAKGIDREIVEKTLAGAEIDDLGMAIGLAQRQSRSMEHLDDAARQRRLMGFLQRRGFRYNVIKSALEQINLDKVSANQPLDEGPCSD